MAATPPPTPSDELPEVLRVEHFFTAKQGTGIRVGLGGQVRLGLVELTFLDAVGPRDLVAHVSRG